MTEEMFNPACLSDFQLSPFRQLQGKTAQETSNYLWMSSITLTITTVFLLQRREMEANTGTDVFWVTRFNAIRAKENIVITN